MAAIIKIHLKCSRKRCSSKQVITVGSLTSNFKGNIITEITSSRWRLTKYSSVVFCSTECETKCRKIGSKKL